MTTHYTPAEDRWLNEMARQRGDQAALDLILCSDGIYRSASEKEQFDRSGGNAATPYQSGWGHLLTR